jgi:vacuolar-type H+-ATPase subunit I/STV1
MNSETINEIVIIAVVIILGEVLMRISKTIFTRYQILERRLFWVVFILFFLGLFFPVIGVLFLVMEEADNNLTPTNIIVFSLSILFGIGLLILLGVIIVRKDEFYPVDPNRVVTPLADRSFFKAIRENRQNKRTIWGWIFTIGGFLVAAGCLYLFLAYGPMNDPAVTAEQAENDKLINTCCGSVAFVGVITLIIGLDMLRPRRNTPKE